MCVIENVGLLCREFDKRKSKDDQAEFSCSTHKIRYQYGDKDDRERKENEKKAKKRREEKKRKRLEGRKGLPRLVEMDCDVAVSLSKTKPTVMSPAKRCWPWREKTMGEKKGGWGERGSNLYFLLN